jgi:hypothetical protein
MLTNFSLASNASALKFAMAYEDFNMNADYSSDEKKNLPTYELEKSCWVSMCSRYRKQDLNANRDFKNNVSAKDYEHFKDEFKGKCHICSRRFSSIFIPTLDRIDCKKSHTIDNVKACCELCNKSRSNRDLDETKLWVKLRQYALKNHLPHTIGPTANISMEQPEKVHNQIRGGITGGLSNVWHRKNIGGKTKINKVYVEETESMSRINEPMNNTDGEDKQTSFRVISKDNANEMTHVIGVDFNSLYPFSMGSIRVPWNPYDNGIMYMPGTLKEYSDDPVRAKQLFEQIYAKRYTKCDAEAKNGDIFIITLKAHMPEEHWNEFINFPPVFRNILIDAMDEKVVGSKTLNQIKNVKIKRGVEKKLTCLLDTYNQFMTFSNYYLFFLLDTCHLVIDEIKEITIFHKTDCFNKFVTTMMSRRIQAMMQHNKGMEKYCKMVLNSSYGFDIKNNDNYNPVKICSWKEAMMAQSRDNFVSTRRISDDVYIVTYRAANYKCDTCIQCGFMTLDNAKFAYLMLYYGF